MARYVSIDEIDKIYRKLGCSENEIEIAHMIEDLPTVDAVEVVHGDWINGTCNNCGQVDFSKPNYCPNCGAKMDGGDKE